MFLPYSTGIYLESMNLYSGYDYYFYNLYSYCTLICICISFVLLQRQCEPVLLILEVLNSQIFMLGTGQNWVFERGCSTKVHLVFLWFCWLKIRQQYLYILIHTEVTPMQTIQYASIKINV